MYLAPLYILIIFIDPQGVRLWSESRGPEPQDKKSSRDHIPQHPQAKLNLELNIGRETITEGQSPIFTACDMAGHWGSTHTQVLSRGPASNRLYKTYSDSALPLPTSWLSAPSSTGLSFLPFLKGI